MIQNGVEQGDSLRGRDVDQEVRQRGDGEGATRIAPNDTSEITAGTTIQGNDHCRHDANCEYRMGDPSMDERPAESSGKRVIEIEPEGANDTRLRPVEEDRAKHVADQRVGGEPDREKAVIPYRHRCHDSP